LCGPFQSWCTNIERIKNDPECAQGILDRENRRQNEFDSAKNCGRTWWNRPPRILRSDPLSGYQSVVLREKSLNSLTLSTSLVAAYGRAGRVHLMESLSGERPQPPPTSPSIFGYIGVDEFEIITKVVGEKMIVFVNEIAEIVHGIVYEYNGFVYQNSPSGGFLLIWPTPPDETDAMAARMGELAVMASLQILAAIRKAPVIQEYAQHPLLNVRLSTRFVGASIALHRGHAIEGVVGSSLRVEANYIGQDAVIPKEIQQIGTATYQCSITLTNSVYRILSPRFQRTMCRRIERVAVVGLEVDLYVVDIDLSGLKNVDENRRHDGPDSMVYRDHRGARKREKLDLTIDLVTSADIVQMRQKFGSNVGELFKDMYNKGLLNYEAGEWDLARSALEQTRVFWYHHRSREERKDEVERTQYEDGPSVAILKHMKNNKWIGTRRF